MDQLRHRQPQGLYGSEWSRTFKERRVLPTSEQALRATPGQHCGHGPGAPTLLPSVEAAALRQPTGQAVEPSRIAASVELRLDCAALDYSGADCASTPCSSTSSDSPDSSDDIEVLETLESGSDGTISCLSSQSSGAVDKRGDCVTPTSMLSLTPRPSPDLIDGEEYWEIERVVNSFYKGKNGDERLLYYTVLWKGYEDTDNLEAKELETRAVDAVADFHYTNPKKPKPQYYEYPSGWTLEPSLASAPAPSARVARDLKNEQRRATSESAGLGERLCAAS